MTLVSLTMLTPEGGGADLPGHLVQQRLGLEHLHLRLHRLLLAHGQQLAEGVGILSTVFMLYDGPSTSSLAEAWYTGLVSRVMMTAQHRDEDERLEDDGTAPAQDGPVLVEGQARGLGVGGFKFWVMISCN